MDRSNHYEAAFEAYLQVHRHCYVAVDETRRPHLGDLPLKSLDFIVYAEQGARLLVDVKGRRFPSGSPDRQRRVWECWSTEDDLVGLEQWTALFGPGFRGLLVFMYEIMPSVDIAPDTEDLWYWRERRYVLRGILADAYRQHMKVRSPKWGTVTLPRSAFWELVKPFSSFTQVTELAVEECPF